jgi:hypothetical protein
VVTEFPAASNLSGPEQIVTRRNLRFTEEDGNRIGTVTPKGTPREFVSGITPVGDPFGITRGTDGAVWFTEFFRQNEWRESRRPLLSGAIFGGPRRRPQPLDVDSSLHHGRTAHVDGRGS